MTPLWMLEKGVRVGTMPHTDDWWRGQRYGTVVGVGHKWVTVKMWSGPTRKYLIEGKGTATPGVLTLRTLGSTP